MASLYFDCSGGAAGDMILAALLSLGAPRDVLDAAVSRLGLDARVTAMPVKRNSIAALLVNVDDGHHAHAHTPHTPHQSPNQAYLQSTVDAHGPHAHVNRTLDDIVALIEGAKLAKRAAENAIAVFRRLADAEAAVHKVPAAQVHFHEVGAVDSLVDIVGTAILLDALAPESIIVSPLPYGYGDIHSAHGVMPNPAPATAELMKGVPSRRVDIEGELVTPTAAALLTHYASAFTNEVGGTIRAIGYGAGTKQYDGSSGLLRVLQIDAAADQGMSAGRVSSPDPAAKGRTHEGDHVQAHVLECNIDDMTPEALAYVQSLLREAGADDVWLTPIVMKKSRAAFTLSVLTEGDVQRFADIIMRETSSNGLRIVPLGKMKLPREMRTVTTEFGDVRVKVSRADSVTKMKPEYDDVERIAREKRVPIADVYAAVSRAWRP